MSVWTERFSKIFGPAGNELKSTCLRYKIIIASFAVSIVVVAVLPFSSYYAALGHALLVTALTVLALPLSAIVNPVALLGELISARPAAVEFLLLCMAIINVAFLRVVGSWWRILFPRRTRDSRRDASR